MGNIKSMSKFANNGKMRSAKDALLDSIGDISEDGVLNGSKKILILHLDDDNDQFRVNFNQAGMNMSQCLALCEVAKTLFLEQMEYING